RFAHRIGNRHGNARALQRTQIHNIVADVTNRVPAQFFLRQEFFDRGDLAVTVFLLDEKIDFEFARAQGRRRRWPGRDPADFQAGAPQQHEAETVLDVEWFELTRAADEHRTVGQHAVHVAEQELDALET